MNYNKIFDFYWEEYSVSLSGYIKYIQNSLE